MTVDSVRSLARRLLGKPDPAARPLRLMVQDDPISKERIEEMQTDIDSKLRKGMKFTPAGPSGW